MLSFLSFSLSFSMLRFLDFSPFRFFFPSPLSTLASCSNRVEERLSQENTLAAECCYNDTLDQGFSFLECRDRSRECFDPSVRSFASVIGDHLRPLVNGTVVGETLPFSFTPRLLKGLLSSTI